MQAPLSVLAVYTGPAASAYAVPPSFIDLSPHGMRS
jgi:hypothetical protein